MSFYLSRAIRFTLSCCSLFPNSRFALSSLFAAKHKYAPRLWQNSRLNTLARFPLKYFPTSHPPLRRPSLIRARDSFDTTLHLQFFSCCPSHQLTSTSVYIWMMTYFSQLYLQDCSRRQSARKFKVQTQVPIYWMNPKGRAGLKGGAFPTTTVLPEGRNVMQECQTVA
jgi:hypothetical protein